MGRPRTNRIVKTYTLKEDTVNKLNGLGEKWGVPIGYVIDKIVEEYDEKKI